MSAKIIISTTIIMAALFSICWFIIEKGITIIRIMRYQHDDRMCQNTERSIFTFIFFKSFLSMGLVAIGVFFICVGELIVIWMKEIKSADKSQKPWRFITCFSILNNSFLDWVEIESFCSISSILPICSIFFSAIYESENLKK